MKIYRELPKNFKPEDLSLFPNIEEGTVIPKPSIKTFKIEFSTKLKEDLINRLNNTRFTTPVLQNQTFTYGFN